MCGRPSRRVALPPSPRPAPGPCSPAEPRPALAHSPDLQAFPGALQRRRQGSLGGTPASAVGSCHGRHRPSHPRAPAAPWEQPEPIHKLVGTRSSPPRRPGATERRSPAFLSTAAAGPTSNAYIRGPRARPSTQATSFYPPSAPNTQQSTSGSFLPRLRSVRSPPQSSAVRRNQGLPHPSNATVRLPSTVRSRPASKLQSGATTAQIPNRARSLRRREARRR